jgi:hypothetical protein
MRYSVLLLSSVGMACASSGSNPPPPPVTTTQQVRVGSGMGDGLSFNISGNTSTIEGSLPYAIDRVWSTLPAVYDSLGIPVSSSDPASRTLANTGMRIRRRLKNTPLTRYFDCGNTQGGPSAETYELTVAVTTRLSSASPSTTTVATMIEASGRPVSFSGDPVNCVSKTNLERAIFEGVKARLAQPSP